MPGYDSKKCILIITYNDFPVYEGLGVRIKSLSQVFLEHGYEVIIYAPNIDRKLAKKENLMGCQIIRANIYVPAFLKKRRTIARAWSMIAHTFLTPFVYFKYLRKKKILVIQAEQVYSIPPAIFIRAFKKTKIVVDDIGTVSDMMREAGSKTLAKLFTCFEKFIFEFCYSFIYTSPVSALYYRQRGAEPAFFVPNGVDCNEFKPAGPGIDKTILFFNASTFSQQNCAAIANFIKIGKDVLSTLKADVEIRLICSPLYNLPLSVQNDIYSNRSWLQFIEGVEDIAAEIGKSDITILAYDKGHHLTGGVRLKSLEYMACGKVVVSTPEGVEGISNLVPDVHFLLAESVDSIPGIISTIIHSTEKMRLIGKNAREFVLANYDWKKISEDLVKGYDSYK